MSLAKNVAWMLAGRWSYNLITLVSFSVIVSLISTASFGIFALASTFFILSDTFFSDGIENLVVKHEGDDRTVAATGFAVSVAIAAVFAAVVIAIAWPFAAFFEQPALREATILTGMVIFIQGLSIAPRALLLRRGQTHRYMASSTLACLIGAGTGIALALHGWGFWSLILQLAAYHFAILVFAAWQVGLPRLGALRAGAFGAFMRQALTLLWSSLLNVLGNRLDILVMGAVFGAAATGVYALAKRLIQIAQDLVASSFDKILIATLSSRRGQTADAEQDRAIHRSTVFLQGLFAIPSFVGFAVAAHVLVPYVFGAEWSGAAPLIALMAAGGIFRATVTIDRARQLASGQLARIAHIRLLELVIGLIVILPFASLGATYLAAIFSLRMMLGYLLVQWSRHGWPAMWDELAQVAQWLAIPVAASLVMGATVFALDHTAVAHLAPPWRLAVLIPAGVVAFVAVLALLRRRWWGLVRQPRSAAV